nr:BTB/POZ domain [Pandoravirus massiliensis]
MDRCAQVQHDPHAGISQQDATCDAASSATHGSQGHIGATDERRTAARMQMEQMLSLILENGCAGNEWALGRYAQLDAMAYPRASDGVATLDRRALDDLLAEMNTLARFLVAAPKTGADAETTEWARQRHHQADRLFVESHRALPPLGTCSLLDAVLGYVHDNPIKVGAALAVIVGFPLAKAILSAPSHR